MYNVLVVSHRRSGTHLVIDFILNNFISFSSLDKPYRSLEFLFLNSSNKSLVTNFLSDLNSSTPLIVKSHSTVDYHSFYRYKDSMKGILDIAFSSSKIIYVYREPKDVMTSLFFYLSQQINGNSISTFLRQKNTYHSFTYSESMTIVEYWIYHINSWINKNVLFISFEEILYDYKKSLYKIRNYTNLELKENIFDITGQFKGTTNFRITAIKPRCGKTGQFNEYLNPDDIHLINTLTQDIYQKLKLKSKIL